MTKAEDITLSELRDLMRSHARMVDQSTLGFWLNEQTLRRYLEWVPSPLPDEKRLAEIGCYQPSVGYYFHLGWQEVVGIFSDEGECNTEQSYKTSQGSARMISVDVERNAIPLDAGWADVVLMMEVFEHFGIDPMHALWEANRILKPGGRVVFSTPNAASFHSLVRILRGMAPHGALEFNGFSSNRHNRLYSAAEFPQILGSAGFRIDHLASRSFLVRSAISDRASQLLLRAIDSIAHALGKSRREREDFIFVRATKDGPPRERYPRDLYFNPADYPSWLKTLDREPSTSLL